MSRNFFLFLLVSLFFLFSRTAFAGLSINEIMYDLDGSDIDYVEVINNGSDVDLSTIKLFVSSSTSNHGIVNYSGSSVLHDKDIGIIVVSSSISNYISKWGSSGNIFTSSFSLPNDTGNVQINGGDKSSPIDSVTYDTSKGASGDGKSLQLISSVWKALTPTPGTENIDTPSTTPSNSGTGGQPLSPSSDVSSTQNNSQTANKEYPIVTQIIGKSVGSTGLALNLNAKTTGHYGEPLSNGKYFWNFGDGDSKEINVSEQKEFSHTYFYPGEYTVSLFYFANPYVISNTPDASAEMIIKVLDKSVSISKVGDEKDFFVEITNETNYSLDLSGWYLSGESKSFVFPRNTTLGANKRIIISSKISGLNFRDKDFLKLLTPAGEIVFAYNQNESVVTPETVKTENSSSASSQEIIWGVPVPNFPKEEDVINLSASAIQSEPTEKDKKNSSSFVWPAVFVLLLGGGSGAVYYLRQKKAVTSAGEDFEILEE